MGIPTGKIVARPMVKRACGHEQEFQYFEVDKYRQQRLAAFQKSRCAACVAKLNEEQKKAADSMPSRGEVFQLLPVGARITMALENDGLWKGALEAGGVKVEEDCKDGPRGLVLRLARKWQTEKGTGKAT